MCLQLSYLFCHLPSLIPHPLEFCLEVDRLLLLLLRCLLIASAITLEPLAYLSHSLQLLVDLLFLHVKLKSFGFLIVKFSLEVLDNLLISIFNSQLLRNLLVDIIELLVLDLKPHFEIMSHLLL